MTPDEAHRGCVELMLPQGGCVKVEFRDELSANPDLEAEVVRMMLDAEGTDGDVCQAIVDYAEISGLGARFFLGSRDIVVQIFDAAAARGAERGLVATRHESDIEGELRESDREAVAP